MKNFRFFALSGLTLLALGSLAAGCGGGVSTGFDAVTEEISAPVIEARENREGGREVVAVPEPEIGLVPEAVKTQDGGVAAPLVIAPEEQQEPTIPPTIGTSTPSEEDGAPIGVGDPSDTVSPPADTPDTNDEQVAAAGLAPVTVDQKAAPGQPQQVQVNYQLSAERQTQPAPVQVADTVVVYEDRSTPPTPQRRVPCLLVDCR